MLRVQVLVSALVSASNMLLRKLAMVFAKEVILSWDNSG